MTRADLAGIRVVTVEQAVAAPLCTRHLADLGADVVKIERPGSGDFARSYDEVVHGYASHFVWLSRGKRSVTLDLKSAPGREALLRLLEVADVLVCNLGPGAFDRIVTDDELHAINPRLIRCHISGYGPTGPFARRKAYDMLVQGEAGIIAATGTPEQPAKPGVSLADLAGGAYALAAISAALHGRAATGLGRRLDIALFDVLLEWMSPLLLAELHGIAAPVPAGIRHPSICPYGPFHTADGDTLLLAVQNDGQWSRLCERVLLRPELLDEVELQSNSGRVRNRDRTEALVQERLSGLTTSRVLTLLAAADIPHGRVNQVRDVLRSDQASATGRWSPVTLPSGRSATVVTSPFSTSAELPRAVPGLGQHTEDVLAELGLTPVEASMASGGHAPSHRASRQS